MSEQSEHDFEDRLAQVLRRTGDGFRPDGPHLVAAGAARGRRRQHRQLALVAGAAAAVVAAGGLTAVLLPGGGAAAGPAAGRSGGPSGAAADGPSLVSALAERLPAGVRVLRSAGDWSGVAGLRVAGESAELTLDDGHGAGLVTVLVSDVRGRQVKSGCPLSNSSNEACEVRPGPDGGSLTVGAMDPDPGPRGTGTAAFTGPDGLRVVLSAYSFADQEHQDRTRPTPVLTPDQLAALAADPVWASFRSGLSPDDPSAGATLGPDGSPVRLRELLPPGLRTASDSEWAGGQRLTAAQDGHELVLTVRAQRADRAARDWFAAVPAGADGVRVRATTAREVPGSQGATESAVDVLRPDGVRVRVTAVNPAGAGSPDAGKPPLLSAEQLRGIALDPRWAAPDAR
ncbi:hypothetical protein ABZ747_08540 [Kitasatospora cineracea]|uniref:hypothetical protein n=1 Tax=Kitasatospora cineracea TaxID=88074 RepID=UPI003406A0B9